MRRSLSTIFFVVLFSLLATEVLAKHAIMIVLDASGSMSGRKIKNAKKGIIDYISGTKNITDNDIVGFRIFGGACDTSRLIISPAKGGKSQFSKNIMALISASGNTPLEYAMSAAISDLAGLSAESKTIVVFTDGEETCGGDPCTTVHKAKKNNSDLRIFTVDLGGVAHSPQIDCLSDAPPIKISKEGQVSSVKLANELKKKLDPIIKPPSKFGQLLVEIKNEAGVKKPCKYTINNLKNQVVKKGIESGNPVKIEVGQYTLDFSDDIKCSPGKSITVNDSNVTEVSCQLNLGELNAVYKNGSCKEVETSYAIIDEYGNIKSSNNLTGKPIALPPGKYKISFHGINPRIEEEVEIIAGQPTEITIDNFGTIQIDLFDSDGKAIKQGIIIRHIETGRKAYISTSEVMDVLEGTYDAEVVMGFGGSKEDIIVKRCKPTKSEIKDCCQLSIISQSFFRNGDRVFVYEGRTVVAQGKVGTPIDVRCNTTVDVKVKGREMLDVSITTKRKDLNESDFED